MEDDFESVVEELSAKGASFERYAAQAADENGVHTFGEEKVFWFRDPDGNTLAVDNGGVPRTRPGREGARQVRHPHVSRRLCRGTERLS